MNGRSTGKSWWRRWYIWVGTAVVSGICLLFFAGVAIGLFADLVQLIKYPAKAHIYDTMVSEIDGMVSVFVPEGEFEMGASLNSLEDEVPVHSVYLDAFWIDQTEVTNAMFAAFLNDIAGDVSVEDDQVVYYEDEPVYGLICSGCDYWEDRILWSDSALDVVPGYENHPAALVTWYGAEAYCAWAGRRLPSEAEWEKAARGVRDWYYPWGYLFDGSLTNADDETKRNDAGVSCYPNGCDGYDTTAPVGSFPDGASPYGALDMSGNVWEWAADWYGEDYYSNSPPSNPPGPASGEFRVRRGGSWWNLARAARSDTRSYREPEDVNLRSGFRCARNVAP